MTAIVQDIPFAIVLDTDHSFTPAEVQPVIDGYVCAICHAELVEVQVPNEQRRLIVCPEHGNVCDCGRVTRATVSIEYERAYRSYHEVIRNLSDLWGHLADQGFDRNKASIITKNYVCAVCGGTLYMFIRSDDRFGDIIDIKCSSHGNINLCGHTKKSEFVYDFQRIRAWERENRKRR